MSVKIGGPRPKRNPTLSALMCGVHDAHTGHDGAPWQRDGGSLWDDATEDEYLSYAEGYNAAIMDRRRLALDGLRVGSTVRIHESVVRGSPTGIVKRLGCRGDERGALVEHERNGKAVRKWIGYGALAPVGSA